VGELNNKTILVTGASKGIGRAIAVRLAADGFSIVVHYGADRPGAEETLKQVEATGAKGRCVTFDVADRAQCASVLDEDGKLHGNPWGVVLNAAIVRDNAFPALQGDEWDLVLRTNLDGFYNVLHPLIMPMVRAKKGGRIVAVTSMSGLVGNRGQSNYAASKAGIIGAAKSVAIELATRAITVNCVAPGIIETQMTESLPPDVIKMIPMQRMGRPEEVAAVVGFLCSDAASYVTRQVISVNGGLL
jgi:3-oxoacyl-[acyl-carrier protein] reductase